MSVTFELWDMGTGNFLEKFASETAMLHAVREYTELEGDAYLDELAVRPVREVDGVRDWLPKIDGQALRTKLAAASRPYVGVVVRVSCNEQQRLFDGVSRQLHLIRGLENNQMSSQRDRHIKTPCLTPREAAAAADVLIAV